MKKILFLFVLSVTLGCASSKTSTQKTTSKIVLTQPEKAVEFAKIISATDLKDLLYIIASDDFEGRSTGEEGQKKAANFIKDFYIQLNIASPYGGQDYFQNIPTEHLKAKIKPSENIVAFIEGSEKPEEIIVISAHYDHLGTKNGEIYNGADDDGSGTVAVMEIAKAFKNASENGYQPKRSLLFLHVTGEEKGLLGSKYYTNFPIFPLEKTVTDLNIDMIGRVDTKHEENPNYVYLIGSDKLSKELHQLSEKVNEYYTQLELDYTYNDENEPNRFYYRSDHYNFAKNNIPIIFYFNGTHADYHKATDTPDKINYEILAKRAQLIFYTAWEIANREKRIMAD